MAKSEQRVIGENEYQNGLRESNLRAGRAQANLWNSLAAIVTIAAILSILVGFGTAIYLAVVALTWAIG